MLQRLNIDKTHKKKTQKTKKKTTKNKKKTKKTCIPITEAC